MRQFHLLIDGQLTGGANTLDVLNPAHDALLATCPRADAAQLDAAVAAAKAAFPLWAATPLTERRQRLLALADALEQRIAEFALLLTEEQGKPLGAATYEIGGSIAAIRAIAAMALPLETLRDTAAERIVRQRTPLGVVAAIVPWNFPMLLLTMKIAPALLAGNTVVAKPAPTTPLTALSFGRLCAAVLPAGVINIIVDQNDLGARLVGHADVAKVSFTGSTATGRKVMQSAAANLSRLTLELGGNDPAIVLEDADVHAAAAQIFEAATLNAGQLCLGPKRIYVHASIHDALCEELVRLANSTVVGDGTDPATQMGPLQNKAQFARVRAYLDDAHTNGKVIAGGHVLQRPGYFVAPTVVRDLPDTARLVREEQFGPVLPVLQYEDIDDAIRRVNDSEYGLGATLWTTNPERALDVARSVDAGVVWINKFLDLPWHIAVGGAKKSGFGVALGQQGLEEFTQGKVINMAL